MARARQSLHAVAVSAPAVTRAAIYTRKSTDEGLASDFNTLDNQRDRSEAYIASQDCWEVVADRYDDGGFSGGTIERPALKQLLADVEAGKINAIVVYRLDRMSRSLLDFNNIHHLLEKHGVALVSVTESINTRSPGGRMMINVLLSFAQYERELGAERTRHKIHSARKKGKWTGGRPVLGYDATDGHLIINADEAALVTAIFDLYIELESLIAAVQELNRRGWRQKKWTTKAGRDHGGNPWNKTSLRTLLTNPLYIGKQKLGDETFPGEHKAIVQKKLFDRAQNLMSGNRDGSRGPHRNAAGFLLRGLLRCSACDAAMTPSSTKTRGKLYGYYTCTHAQKQGHGTCPSKSIPASKVEDLIVDQVRRIGADPQLQDETFRAAVAQVKDKRRGLKRERKMLKRDLANCSNDVGRLVDGVTRTSGPAAEAITGQLQKAQEQVQTLDARLGEIGEELAALKAQEVDRDDLTMALEDFSPIWDALVISERERVLRLLVERIDYDGGTGEMSIQWRLSGFAQLSKEVGP